jgi:hypothetical protein
LDPKLSNLLMTEKTQEIGHLLDFLHSVYLIQCVWNKSPQIDYEPFIEVIQNCDRTYDDLD